MIFKIIENQDLKVRSTLIKMKMKKIVWVNTYVAFVATDILDPVMLSPSKAWLCMTHVGAVHGFRVLLLLVEEVLLLVIVLVLHRFLRSLFWKSSF